MDPVPLAAVDPADVAPAPLPDGGHARDPARVSAHLGVSVSVISSIRIVVSIISISISHHHEEQVQVLAQGPRVLLEA